MKPSIGGSLPESEYLEMWVGAYPRFQGNMAHSRFSSIQPWRNSSGQKKSVVSLHPKAFPFGTCVEECTLFEMFLFGGSWPCLPCSFLSEAAAKGGFPANGKRGLKPL